jgi:hypothetical protein
MADLRFYSKALTQAEVSALYNKYAKLPVFIDDLSDANESVAANSGEFLENTDWRINSGSFKISRDTVDGKPSKVIECDSAGEVGMPLIDNMPGTIEFDFYHNTAHGGLQLCEKNGDYTVAGNTGYFFRFSVTEKLILYRLDGGGTTSTLMITDTNYIDEATWYKARITTRYDGQFSWYIKGGSFTDWTLVDTTGGSGTNPVTDATYTSFKWIVLDLAAGDKVTNIKRYYGVLDPT